MQTGSFVNLIMSGNKNSELPKVGDGATILHWTDRTAGTVISVSEKAIEVQEDKDVRTDKNGMSDSQEYEYSPNSQGCRWIFKRVARGKYKGFWRVNGRSDGEGVRFGERDKYYDFSF